ncbi:MAG: DUF6850 family outer membrane beta-barrel protein [Marinilabiliaceae bacterium]
MRDEIYAMRIPRVIGVVLLLAQTLLPPSATYAQESLLSQRPNSPLESDYQAMSVRPEETMRDAMLGNPAALCGTMRERRLFFNDNPCADKPSSPITVVFNGATGRMDGDYIPVLGNSFDDVSVLANGYMGGDGDVLYGKAGFTTGGHRGIGWNTLRSPETYWPYIVADSTGGNMGYETYNLMVAYSFGLGGNVDLGISGEYTGDFAYRKTDPRIEDITTWLLAKVGASYRTDGHHRLSLDVEYQFHRQHSEVKHFRSGQFAGFFTEYGFGMFDYVHSSIFNSTKDLQLQHSYGTALQYSSSPQRPFRANGRVAYDLDVMKTEENTYKLNLYRALTSRVAIDMSALWNSDSWGAELIGQAAIASRKGREYIFERYVSDQVDGVDVYDYRKIGHNDRYTLRKASADAQLKLSKYVGPSSTFSVIGALDLLSREERYGAGGYKIVNTLLTPHIGLEVQRMSDSFDSRLTVRYGRRKSLENKYQVNVDLDRHTEYQHAFSPYAYYSHSGNVVTAEAEASHMFGPVRLGLKVQALIVRANRLKDAIYDRGRYDNAIPFASKHSVSLAADAHDQNWTKFSLFAEF